MPCVIGLDHRQHSHPKSANTAFSSLPDRLPVQNTIAPTLLRIRCALATVMAGGNNLLGEADFTLAASD